jgi:hypothetical protein
MLIVLATQVIIVLLWGFSGFDLGPIAFSHLRKRLSNDNSDSKVVFFAHGTGIIITSPNQEGLKIALKETLSDIISWFKAIFLLFSFNKTYYLQLRTKNFVDNTLDTNYLNKTIANIPYTKYLGLVVDDTFNLESISRLNSACYTITAVNAMLSRKSLRTLYFSYVHSIISFLG